MNEDDPRGNAARETAALRNRIHDITPSVGKWQSRGGGNARPMSTRQDAENLRPLTLTPTEQSAKSQLENMQGNRSTVSREQWAEMRGRMRSR